MSLRLSKEHGLNPSLLVCPICGKDVGIALLGANGGKKAPYQMTSIELCNDCKQKVKEGNTFILSAKQTSEGIKPTGAYILVPNECLNVPISSKGIYFMEEFEFNKLINNSKQNETD